MPKRRLPNLQFERTRHGRLVWYVRVKRGPRVRMPGEYGSQEFTAAYHAAIKGGSPARAIKGSVRGSLHWLIDKWRQSSDWASTAVATRRQRENILLCR